MNESLLVNTLGHSAGVLIFGIFLYLLIEDRAARRLRGDPRVTDRRLSIVVLDQDGREVHREPVHPGD